MKYSLPRDYATARVSALYPLHSATSQIVAGSSWRFVLVDGQIILVNGETGFVG